MLRLSASLCAAGLRISKAQTGHGVDESRGAFVPDSKRGTGTRVSCRINASCFFAEAPMHGMTSTARRCSFMVHGSLTGKTTR